MSPSNDENRRERFRLRLPTNSGLRANIGGIDHQIVEVAEFSMVVTEQYVINENGACSGTICWSDGRSVLFTGEVGRMCASGRVIDKINGITTHDILKEQRRLLKKFPAVIDHPPTIFKPEIFSPETD